MKAEKRKRIEEEKITDEKINDWMKQLERSIQEGKEGVWN